MCDRVGVQDNETEFVTVQDNEREYMYKKEKKKTR